MGYLSNIKECASIVLTGLVSSCYSGCATVGQLLRFAFGRLLENIKLFSTILGGTGTSDVNNQIDENSLNNNSDPNKTEAGDETGNSGVQDDEGQDNSLNDGSDSNSNEKVSNDVNNAGAQDGGHAVSNVEKRCSYGGVKGGFVGGLVGLLVYLITCDEVKEDNKDLFFLDVCGGILCGSLYGNNAICGADSASSDVEMRNKSIIAKSMRGGAAVGAVIGAVGAGCLFYSRSNRLEHLGYTLPGIVLQGGYFVGCLAGTGGYLVGTAASSVYSALNKQDENHHSIPQVVMGDNLPL